MVYELIISRPVPRSLSVPISIFSPAAKPKSTNVAAVYPPAPSLFFFLYLAIASLDMLSRLSKWSRTLLPGRYQQDSPVTNRDSDSSQPPGQQSHQYGAEEQHQIMATPCYQDNAIDPLIAARAHNTKKGQLTALPKEILFCVLEQVGDDVVTLYRHIIYEPRI